MMSFFNLFFEQQEVNFNELDGNFNELDFVLVKVKIRYRSLNRKFLPFFFSFLFCFLENSVLSTFILMTYLIIRFDIEGLSEDLLCI